MTSYNEVAAEADATPTLSRRHAAGAPSARGLLFTVLGEFVLTRNDTVWTSTLIDVLGELGIEEKATRQALMRTASDGWLCAERIGRRTRWHLTDASRQMLTEGAERIYSFSGATTAWDGKWLLVSARVPETDRRARHILRSQLSWAGFGSLAPGLWISSHPDREAEATRVLAGAGIEDAHIFVAEHQGQSDARTMIGQAWDLDAIERAYEEFIGVFDARVQGSALTRQIELVQAWRRFPAIDPVLPHDLLPARWSGHKAGKVFARRHAQWSADAIAEWARLEQAVD